MLTNKIFNASALTKPIYSNLCFLSNFAMLSIKDTFAYFQKQLCLLANIFKFNNGYQYTDNRTCNLTIYYTIS